MMLEADILLKGQGTSQQQLVPVMGQPPNVDSDLTFEEWVHTTKHSGKGLKIDFQSIEAVELALQTLKGVKSKVSSLQHRENIYDTGSLCQHKNMLIKR